MACCSRRQPSPRLPSRSTAREREHHLPEIVPYASSTDHERPGRTRALPTPCISEQRSNAGFPVADRLVGKSKAALEDQLGEVTEAALGASTPEHDRQDDVRGERKLIVGSPRALMELPSACGAANDATATVRSLRPFRGGCGGARWARHPVLPGMRGSEPTRIPEKSEDILHTLKSDTTTSGPRVTECAKIALPRR